MPGTYGFVQTAMPNNSALAQADIPSRKLYEPATSTSNFAINGPAAVFNVAGDVATMAGAEYTGPAAVAAAAKFGSDFSNLANAVNGATSAATDATAAATTAATQATAAATNTAGVPTGVGSQSPVGYAETVADYVWAFPGGQPSIPTTLDGLAVAAQHGQYADNNALVRLFSSYSFVTLMYSNYVGTELQPGVVLNAAYEGAKTSWAETDLAMLERVYPGYSWANGHLGLPLAGATIQGGDGVYREYWYLPPGPSLSQMYHLWDFTSSSGSPQNGIAVFMQFLALVPVQW